MSIIDIDKNFLMFDLKKTRKKSYYLKLIIKKK